MSMAAGRAAVVMAFVLALLAPRAGSAQQPAPADTFRLARIFGDGMVLQRDAPVPIWGWAAPGTVVAAELGGRIARDTAGRDGAWAVEFPAMAAGGPYALAVTAGGSRRTVRDIVVGDVWVASGQSNMEWPLSLSNDAARAIAGARDSLLRHFKVPTSWSWTPEADVAGGRWVAADSATAGAFSAVGYFFARELRRTVDVPIGILNTTWGGSNIQTWMSRASQALDDTAWASVLAREEAHRRGIRDTLLARLGELPTVDAGLQGIRAVWADPALDDAGWRTLAVPGAWERSGFPGMDGVAWYRTAITLTEAEARQGARLMFGAVDDADITWVNGVEVGRTSGYNVPRAYEVPASVLRAGRNVVAVRVTDGGGEGGIMGRPEQAALEIGGASTPLAGPWKFRVAVVSLGEDGQHLNKIPAILYHRMVHPLLRFPITGVIWYQGESNANTDAQATAYASQFATLIRSWRSAWASPRRDFPFLWVQLANFGAVDTVPPARAAWATLRESQSAALALPNTGQAITIDVGDPGDIHPRNKQDVGRRLALLARRVAYGHDVVAAGPTYRAHAVRGDSVVIEFDHVGGGLVSRGGDGRVAGFAIAGADRRFVRADARIEGPRVIVWSDAVPRPAAVRYAWSNSPREPSLYNREGLPAAPFRTDAW